MNAQGMRAEFVVTGSGPVHAPGWVIHRGGVILAVGGGEPPGGVTWAAGPTRSIIIPGLVSAHTHLPLGALRGVADDAAFFPWLMGGLMPRVTGEGAKATDWDAGALASAHELLRSGVTLIGDNYLSTQGVSALVATGQRGIFFQEVFGSTAEDLPAYGTAVDAMLDGLGRDLTARPFGYSPHTPWTCPRDIFSHVVSVARDGGRRLSFHLDETAEEHAFFTERRGPIYDRYAALGRLDRYDFGATPTAMLARLGALGPRSVAAHCVHVTPEDIAILAQTGTGVVHCPQSNMKLAEGVAPVVAMRKAGITVALGVDSAASNSRLDMFSEMRAALLTQRAVTGSVAGLTAADALHMATQAGADVLGFGASAGSLDAGKSADLVVLDVSDARHAPVRDPVATAVWTCGPEDVAAVVIGGELRYARDARA